MVNFENSKNAFWMALIVTTAIFVLGLTLGFILENSRTQKIEEFYAHSEISLIDSMALTKFLEIDFKDCEQVSNAQREFADRVYEEALILEQYEAAGKITEQLKLAHKKYDLMRTILWMNILKTEENCSKKMNTIVYLYEYETEDLDKKASQSVWSRVLFELKQNKEDNLLLIPIAADSNISSLELMLKKFNVSKLPALVINNKEIIYELSSSEKLETYLKN